MKREIIFRGKYKNGWKYGSLSDCHNDVFIGVNELRKGHLNMVNYPIKDTDTIGQYTGVRDKDDREIYEDDIVEFFAYGAKYVGVVVYDEYGRYMVKEKDGNSICPIMDYDFTIVGNIHDNPKLLPDDVQPWQQRSYIINH